MKKKLFFLYLLMPTLCGTAQNVGIGTDNPVFKLDVRGGGINTDSVYSIGAITVLAVNDVGNLFIGRYSGQMNTGYNKVNGASSGVNVGIGINNPIATLQVARGTGIYGTAAFQGTSYVSHFNYAENEDTYIRAAS